MKATTTGGISRLAMMLVICGMLAGGLLAGGCARGGKAEPAAPPVVFPLPPTKARVQFLASVSSTTDLPKSRSSFADFILGPDTSNFALAKPNNAVLRGNLLYVCDTVFNTVVVYDLVTGKAHALAGDRGAGEIQQPNNVGFDADGRIYVADKVRKAVLVYNEDESFVAAWGRPEEFSPVSIAVGDEELYVSSVDTHTVEVWSLTDGSLIRTFGGPGSAPGRFYLPTYLALDGAGHLYVTDTGNFRVQKVTLEGEPVAVLGGPGRTLGRFAWPKGIAVDTHGRVYVSDSRFANVQVFDPEGRLLLFFGAPGPDGGNLDLPAGVSVVPWTTVPWLQERLMAGFDAEFLVIVVNQQGPKFINFFALARDTE